jgi:LysR family transcriptional regulator, regulator for metE and metH
MDLDTRTLELLEAVAVDGTLTAAARRMHVSQPALSQRLTSFEARIGVRLFERHGRQLVATHAGRRMIQAATVVLGELRAAERDVNDLRNGRAGVLRFASQCSTNYRWLPPVVQQFAERRPGVEFRIETPAGDDIVGALLEDRLDVGLGGKGDRRLDALESVPLFVDEMVAVVPVDHPLAARSFLRAADFDGVNLILFDSYDPARVPVLPPPIPEGSRPARVTTTPVVSELIVELVAAGQGVAVLADWVAAPYRDSGRVATVRLSDAPQARTWFCAWRRGDDRPHVIEFVDLLKSHFTGGRAPVAA